jgi:hypothetical protein
LRTKLRQVVTQTYLSRPPSAARKPTFTGLALIDKKFTVVRPCPSLAIGRLASLTGELSFVELVPLPRVEGAGFWSQGGPRTGVREAPSKKPA